MNKFKVASLEAENKAINGQVLIPVSISPVCIWMKQSTTSKCTPFQNISYSLKYEPRILKKSTCTRFTIYLETQVEIRTKQC